MSFQDDELSSICCAASSFIIIIFNQVEFVTMGCACAIPVSKFSMLHITNLVPGVLNCSSDQRNTACFMRNTVSQRRKNQIPK
jgi:hypothetical protein